VELLSARGRGGDEESGRWGEGRISFSLFSLLSPF
jgi:hypothetical protein